MAQFSTSKAKIQFLFPFRVDRWETFRNGISAYVDERNDDLFPALHAALNRLQEAFPCSLSVCDARDLIEAYLNGTRDHPNRRKSNASLITEIRALVRKLPTYTQELYLVGQDMCCLELAELIREHDAKGPENLMQFVCQKINSSDLPLFTEAEYRPGDNRGTRGYLERKQPQVEARLRAESLVIQNPMTLPDIAKKLPSQRGKPVIRLSSTVVLMSTGFGCLRLKAHLASEQGLFELVDEIVFTADGRHGKSSASILKKKASLAQDLRAIIPAAVRRRSTRAVETVLGKYIDSLDTKCIADRLRRVVDGVTLVHGELTANDIIDIENLDRGSVRGKEPYLLWKGSASDKSTLCDYFKHIIYGMYLANLNGSLLKDESIHRHVTRAERRRFLQQADSNFKEQLISSVSNLSFQAPSLTIEEHPYVSVFLSAPAWFKDPQCSEASQVVQQFRSMVEKNKKDLSRIVMKSKWSEVRSDWEPAANSLENVFYSDLIHMAVHIRGTLCLYYAPASADEYKLVPELARGYKYREELNNTLQGLRILWYAYAISDQLVTQDIRGISAALEVLKEKSLREEFPEVIEGLADVIRGIDRRKIALVEIMEDPLSRKGGSSLFTEIVEKISQAFHLKTLYENLHTKIERLDMLGIHVNENVQEYSSLLVQEGSRSTQLTLEFLEAFIIAFYATELIALSIEGREVYPFEKWWGFGLLAAGAFLTALPLITLIRKGRSKFALQNPAWLERLEEFGKLAGPALLLTVAYLVLMHSAQLGLVGVLALYLAAVLSIRRSRERVGERAFSWLRKTIGRRRSKPD